MKKKFIIKLSVLITIILGVSFILSHIFHTQVEKKNIFTQQHEEFFNSHNEIKYLVMGDSHAWEGIDPRLLEEDSFNFATGGENYIESYYKLKYLVNSGKKIENIIAEIDPHYFTSLHAKAIDYDYFWTKYINYPELILETKSTDLTKNYLYGLFFAYSDRNTIFRIISGTSYTNEFHLGHRVTTEKLDISTVTDTIIEKRGNVFFSKEYNANDLDPLLIEYLGKFIKLAEENNINLIFVGYPHYQRYLDHIESRIDLVEFNRRIVEEIKKIDTDKDSLILNYLEMYSDNPDYFSDLDHLNQTGAEAFTKLILKDIQDKNNKINYNTEY